MATEDKRPFETDCDGTVLGYTGEPCSRWQGTGGPFTKCENCLMEKRHHNHIAIRNGEEWVANGRKAVGTKGSCPPEVCGTTTKVASAPVPAPAPAPTPDAAPAASKFECCEPPATSGGAAASEDKRPFETDCDGTVLGYTGEPCSRWQGTGGPFTKCENCLLEKRHHNHIAIRNGEEWVANGRKAVGTKGSCPPEVCGTTTKVASAPAPAPAPAAASSPAPAPTPAPAAAVAPVPEPKASPADVAADVKAGKCCYETDTDGTVLGYTGEPCSRWQGTGGPFSKCENCLMEKRNHDHVAIRNGEQFAANGGKSAAAPAATAAPAAVSPAPTTRRPSVSQGTPGEKFVVGYTGEPCGNYSGAASPFTKCENCLMERRRHDHKAIHHH